MICPHCAKNIDIPSAAEIGRKGGSKKSEKKRLAAKKNIEKRWADYRLMNAEKKEMRKD